MEKPILFNTEMVKAILEGRKTVTRRVIKLPKHVEEQENGLYTLYAEGGAYIDAKFETVKDYINPPYKIGDILYVRETWGIQSMKNYGKRVKFLFKAEPNKELKEVALSESRYDDMLKYSFKNGWQPSLFMPREAARIFLEVTNVKVERLQDITTEGCFNEGIKYDYNSQNNEFDTFAELWNSTIKKNELDMYSWNTNPWVWVIEFKRLERKISKCSTVELI